MNTQSNSAFFIPNAIHNPANANHFMVVQQVSGRITIDIADRRVAETTNALRIIEIGKSVYEPRYYIPVADVSVRLEELEKSTHCPIKGDARYYALDGVEIAWGYDTLDFANILEGHLSFAADDLSITHNA